MAWPLAFLYTQVAIVNNTKLSSPGEGKSPLKLAVIEIELRLSFQTQSSQQQCTWKDARSETAQNHMPLHAILSTKRVSQTEQNQLMSTSQEQNVDWEKGRMLRIYIGLLLLLLLLHHHHHIFIVFFYHHHHRISIFWFYDHHHISYFPSRSFYKIP